ncbi:MAG: 3-hydroxybutyrate oligomer hydrolase family protein [Kiloniellales bacterium]|nr:3-hydroxybutyrate oligomer hydrolase family protein [Kiloniellales bacterium]
MKPAITTAAALAMAAAFGFQSAEAKPPRFIRSDVICTQYDGATDDLLTGGLGASGLGLLGTAPTLSDPPTTAELRSLAIFSNYRALVPIDPGGGYGTLFGPNIDAQGEDTGTEGKIAGLECLAYAGRAKGRENVTLMVQVPESFDFEAPCIVTAPSSGSRGVYGAIGTAGEWGLRNGCAVAYTDKGTGNGAHNLQRDTVNLIQGQREDAKVAGRDAAFRARLSDAALAAFNAKTPDRLAYKHAHSQLNPEADWGRNVLESIEFAFAVVNGLCADDDFDGESLARFGGDDDDDGDDEGCGITPENTIVIASSVSNGGGSSVLAAEQDKKGLIDGIAVSEPNVNPKPGGAFGIQQGEGEVLFAHSRSLYDYTTILSVYQGCANLAPSNAGAPFNVGGSEARCTSLFEKGLVSGANTDERAEDAQRIINAAGILPEQNVTQPSNYGLFVPQAIGITYANAYGRFSVVRNLCGYSFGATDGEDNPAELDPADEQALFGAGNGIPPTAEVNVINNDSLLGPKRDQTSISPSNGSADQNLDGALCLRALATGRDPETGKKLRGRDRVDALRIARGISKVRAKGDLRGKPAVFVTGRQDAILAPNHTSRAYVGLNRLVEGAGTGLRYYEVLNAHHLDALTILDVAFNTPLFSDKLIPLHHYLFQALDIMFDHLKNGTPLPPSQVVRAVPRGGTGGPLEAVPPLKEAVNLPAIDPSPDAGDLIVFSGGILRIPD